MIPENVFAMVTGAGKGLGKAFAEVLANKGYKLLLLARNGEGLGEYSKSLQEKYNTKVFYLEIDFLTDNAIAIIDKWIADFDIKMLINNAGVGGSTYFDKIDLNYIDTILQVNVKMVASITRLLIPKLKMHSDSFVLNVSSIASCCPIAYKTVYPASKAFVYSFSKSLALELKPLGIHVSVVMPGPIKTNEEVSRRIEKQGWWVKTGLLTANRLAIIVIKQMLMHRKVIIPGLINKINWLFLKLVPKAISIPIVSRAIKNEIDFVNQCA